MSTTRPVSAKDTQLTPCTACTSPPGLIRTDHLSTPGFVLVSVVPSKLAHPTATPPTRNWAPALKVNVTPADVTTPESTTSWVVIAVEVASLSTPDPA